MQSLSFFRCSTSAAIAQSTSLRANAGQKALSGCPALVAAVHEHDTHVIGRCSTNIPRKQCCCQHPTNPVFPGCGVHTTQKPVHPSLRSWDLPHLLPLKPQKQQQSTGCAALPHEASFILRAHTGGCSAGRRSAQ
eukprot:365863-Chlamydomonas_euryale.AAC.8